MADPVLYFGAYGGRDKRTALLSLYESMRSTRSSFDAHWRELSDFLRPRRSRFFSSDRNRGDKRNQNIIDSSASFAFRTLQSGLHAGLTSPARPWFNLSVSDPDLAKYKPVKEWLYETTKRMRVIFSQSNLYQALPTIYGDEGGFGTAAMAVVDDSEEMFRCHPWPIGSYVLGCDNRQIVSSAGREYELTVEQVVKEFGAPGGLPLRRGQLIDWTTISTYTRNQWDRGLYDSPVTITWVIAPNPDADETRIEAKYRPWSSCHFEQAADAQGAGEQKILRESGFDHFPILAPRWETTGEDTYGTDCPGMMALGDVKQLQSMHRTKGKLVVKAADPAMKGPSTLRNQKVSLVPGDMTYVDVREGNQGLSPIHEVRLEGYQHLVNDVSEVQYRIRRAFFEDLFLMLAASDAQRGAQPLTAREVDERHEEKLLAVGPVLERNEDELHKPLIDIVYAKMVLAKLVPPIPPELDQVKLAVEYTSILAQAQKLVGVVGQDRLLQTVITLASVAPRVLAKLDLNRTVDSYQDILGVDPTIIRSNEDADALLAAEDQANRAATLAAVAKDGAGAAKSASEAKLADGSSALDAIVGGGAVPAAASGGAPA
jgi:Bacteriophage head to tail connecting protein